MLKLRLLIAAAVFTVLGATTALTPVQANHIGPDVHYPNAAITPGWVATTDASVLCANSDEKPEAFKRVNLTRPQKLAVLAAYDISPDRISEYYIERFIPPALGGHQTDLRNLWPMPRSAEPSHAHKASLAAHLKHRVCKGEITAEQAQDTVRTDWVRGVAEMKSRRHRRA
jgi:hypothetical protein